MTESKPILQSWIKRWYGEERTQNKEAIEKAMDDQHERQKSKAPGIVESTVKAAAGATANIIFRR